jgi:hypothetical protein
LIPSQKRVWSSQIRTRTLGKLLLTIYIYKVVTAREVKGEFLSL